MTKLLLFGILFSIIFYIVPWKYRRIYLLVASSVFYLVIDWKMILLLLIIGLWTWAYPLYGKPCKKNLVIEIIFVAGSLVFFKLNQFFVNEAGLFFDKVGLGTSMRFVALLMPVGISYYVFKSISYMVDVYRGKIEPEKELVNVGLYLAFFPEIMSGPISEFKKFKASLINGMRYSDANIQLGAYLIIKGFFMKVVIANRLVGYTDYVFANHKNLPGIALWMAAFFYTIQLYCDFAGYSNIAIGITQILGMHLQENFNRPYLAASIGEFWNRWHISLSSWLKEYIYIPLGGSRKTKIRKNINLLLVFLFSGIWHGSGIHFIVWGAYHGIIRVLSPRNISAKFRPLHVAKTFILVGLGWIFFRADSCRTAFVFLQRMFTDLRISGASIQNAILPFTGDNSSIAYFLVVVLFILIMFVRELYEEKKGIGSYETASIGWQVFLLASIILLGNMRASSFIYANF